MNTLNTLMTLWLITGSVIEIPTTAEGCAAALIAIAHDGIVMVELPTGLPVQAKRAACIAPAAEPIL